MGCFIQLRRNSVIWSQKCKPLDLSPDRQHLVTPCCSTIIEPDIAGWLMPNTKVPYENSTTRLNTQLEIMPVGIFYVCAQILAMLFIRKSTCWPLGYNPERGIYQPQWIFER